MSLFGKSALVAALYVLASPVYAVLGLRKLVKLLRTRRILASGEIICPHCGERNVLDILATCGRCKSTEYGNRLRCNSCGDVRPRFDCDNVKCGATIKVF